MKKALNAWTVDPQAGFEQMFADVKAAGFDGIELNVDREDASNHCLTLSTDEAGLAAVRALSERYALPVVSISTSLWGGRMGADDEFSGQLLARQLQYAAALGATGILTVPGGGYPGIPLLEARAGGVRFLRSQRALIESFGLYVGVENVWNGFFTSPLDMAGFIDAVECPLVGAYFDVGNVTAFSWPERWIEVLGGRIHHVHVKDFKRNRGINSGGTWVDVGEGDVDWKAVVSAFGAIGFDGFLTGEVSRRDPEQPYGDYYAYVARGIDGALRR